DRVGGVRAAGAGPTQRTRVQHPEGCADLGRRGVEQGRNRVLDADGYHCGPGTGRPGLGAWQENRPAGRAGWRTPGWRQDRGDHEPLDPLHQGRMQLRTRAVFGAGSGRTIRRMPAGCRRRRDTTGQEPGGDTEGLEVTEGMKITRILGALVLTLVIGACATPPKVAL